MNINKVFSGNFLKAEDLQGKTVRVTISETEVREFDDGKKIIVHFQGKDKALVANKTNASIIAHNTGSPDTDNWVGTTHHLTTKMVEFKGDLVPSIRVVVNEETPTPPPVQKPPVTTPPKPQTESSEPESDDVPF